MDFEKHPSIQGLEKIEDAFLTPPKESPEMPFYRATHGFSEEVDYYLDDLENIEAREALAESRDNLLNSYKVVAYATMEDSNQNDKEKARLLSGWQAMALEKINSQISAHTTIIQLLEGPWNEEPIDQQAIFKRVLVSIHESKADPKRKSPSDNMKAADQIHTDFSTEVSLIVYRLLDLLTTNDTEESTMHPPTAATPIENTEDITRYLLGRAAIDIDDDSFKNSYWDLDAEINKQD